MCRPWRPLFAFSRAGSSVCIAVPTVSETDARPQHTGNKSRAHPWLVVHAVLAGVGVVVRGVKPLVHALGLFLLGRACRRRLGAHGGGRRGCRRWWRRSGASGGGGSSDNVFRRGPRLAFLRRVRLFAGLPGRPDVGNFLEISLLRRSCPDPVAKAQVDEPINPWGSTRRKKRQTSEQRRSKGGQCGVRHGGGGAFGGGQAHNGRVGVLVEVDILHRCHGLHQVLRAGPTKGRMSARRMQRGAGRQRRGRTRRETLEAAAASPDSCTSTPGARAGFTAAAAAGGAAGGAACSLRVAAICSRCRCLYLCLRSSHSCLLMTWTWRPGRSFAAASATSGSLGPRHVVVAATATAGRSAASAPSLR